MPQIFPTTGTQEGDIAAGIIAGGVYNPNAVITSESLRNTNPIPVTPQNPVPVYPVNALPDAPKLELTPQEKEISAGTSKLQNLYKSLIGKSSFQSEQEKKFGIDTIQGNINDLGSELTRLKNEAAAIPLQLDRQIEKGGTILGSAYTTEQNKRLRDNAIAALGVSSLLVASQGQLATAQSLADRAVGEKYNPIIEEIDALKQNLELIKDDPETSIEDKNRAQKQLDIQNARADAVQIQLANATEIWNVATTAAANGVNFKAAAGYPTLATTLQAISNAPTKEQALQIASSTGLLATPKTTKKTTSDTVTDFATASSNLQRQAIPTAPLTKNGTLSLTYRKRLIDQGLSDAVITWLWEAVIDGNEFDTIREEIRNQGSDPAILDTFVQTLQG